MTARSAVMLALGSLLACGGSSPVEPFSRNARTECLTGAVFGAAEESLYVLPYPVGDERYVSQSYCFEQGGHANQLAYDFDAPIGVPVVAARAGEVLRVIDSFEDAGNASPGQLNYIYIAHGDGSVAFYAHLEQDSSLVEPGDFVAQGEPIAGSGNSGLTGDRPHLHFQVLRAWGVPPGNDVPVNFRNAAGELDARGGLKRALSYRALPY